MEQVETKGKVDVVTIVVNNQPVKFTAKKATGLEIKQAAIDQGVTTIALDFQLFKKEDGKDLEPIKDDQEVSLHDNEQFRATAPDDNS